MLIMPCAVFLQNSEVTSVQALRNIIIASTFVGGFAFTQGVAALDRVSISRQARGSNELRPQDVRDTVLGILLLIGFVCFALCVRAAAHLTFLMCSATGQLTALDFPTGVRLVRLGGESVSAPATAPLTAAATASAPVVSQSRPSSGPSPKAQQQQQRLPASSSDRPAATTASAAGGAGSVAPQSAVTVPAWPAPVPAQAATAISPFAGLQAETELSRRYSLGGAEGLASGSATGEQAAASASGRGRATSVTRVSSLAALRTNGATGTAVELEGPMAIATAANERRRGLSAVDIEMGQGPLPRAVSRRVFSELEQSALGLSPHRTAEMVAISRQISEKIAAPLQALEAAEIGAFCEVMMRRTNISFTLGFRAFYLSLPVVLYAAGPLAFLIATGVIAVFLIWLDQPREGHKGYRDDSCTHGLFSIPALG